MKLEDLGIEPPLFSEALYVSRVELGKCELFVPCRDRDEVQVVKQIVGNYFNPQNEEANHVQ